MTETFFGILAMIFCVIGVVSIIRWAALKLAVNNKAKRIYAVLLREEADIELQMLIDTGEWDSALRTAKVYAVDGGLDESMAEYCRIICENSRVTYVPYGQEKYFEDLF